MQVKTIAVLGSGVMGAGIAAQAANAGAEVILLDIVPKEGENRNALAEKAVERLLKSSPSGFTHPRNAARVTAGNLEDHLELLGKADWIIEAVIERLDIKHAVYAKVEKHRKAGSVVSSNTSTIPLHHLVSGMSEGFQKSFMIAHFFNPPRFMRLLEVVQGQCDAEKYKNICAFADERLGKEIVKCKDTPGFIANRIGVYWMYTALNEAIACGIGVEEADAVMSKPLGIPKTGVFGLFDLIGLDLMPLIAHELHETLPKGDAFLALETEPSLLKKLISEGYTGRKGKGGFTRINKEGGKKIKEVVDLQSGEYRAEQKPRLVSSKAKNIAELLKTDDLGGKYARKVLAKSFAYAASLLPEIADEAASVDAAMKNGYNWKYGIFELIDQLGADAFIALLKQEGVAVPPLLEKAVGKSFYRETSQAREELSPNGQYQRIVPQAGHLWLADIKRGGKPVKENQSARLWDMGDDIACLEYITKMNTVDMGVLEMLEQLPELVKYEFKGAVIGTDGEHFSAGANIGLFLEHAQSGDLSFVSEMIRRGQKALMALKYAPFPMVAAPIGYALGGGCETLLHMDAVQAHIELNTGLVERNVGIIPAWGGSKEMVIRYKENILQAFTMLLSARMSASAEEARDMKILCENSRITINRARLLADAKARCQELSENYAPPMHKPITAGGENACAAMQEMLEKLLAEGKASPHDRIIGETLAHVLSGGGETTVTEEKLLELEHEGFIALLKTKPSQDRIAHMLETGKPLAN